MANHHLPKSRPSLWAVVAFLASSAFAITSAVFMAMDYNPL
jgi:hypothetical protein